MIVQCTLYMSAHVLYILCMYICIHVHTQVHYNMYHMCSTELPASFVEMYGLDSESR